MKGNRAYCLTLGMDSFFFMIKKKIYVYHLTILEFKLGGLKHTRTVNPSSLPVFRTFRLKPNFDAL